MGPSGWCALCWPAVTARCALLKECRDTVTRERAQQQHIEVALRLARCGRRLCAPTESGSKDDEAIRERIGRELHPLQWELALSLGQLLGDVGSADPVASTAAQ